MRAGRAKSQWARWRELSCVLAALGCASLLCAELALADELVLARVGTLSISVADFARRAALVSPLAWRRLGPDWPERRRRFLDAVLIREALLVEHAARRDAGFASSESKALARSLSEQLYAEAARVPASHEELERAYQDHRARHSEPERISLWRISVADEALARRLIGELGRPTEAAFRRLAREHSLDDATRMRAGNLGFVAADGQTHMPELRVSPALFAAASSVKDGQLVAAPVAENGRFAVVWRRESRPARVPPLSEVSPELEALLLERRYFKELGSLLDRLREAELSEHHPELARALEVEAREATRVLPAPVPSPVPAAAEGGHTVNPVPEATDRGLR